jgi:glucuronate isomerase
LSFIHDDFLLNSEMSRRLYHDYAAREPILDYHSHLSAADIASNRRFQNLSEIWLEGDHYKWRAMRANGVAEACCTGNAAPYEKFLAWARTVPFVVRNPLYQWTHLELKRYFGIDDLLDETSAISVWQRANSLLTARDDLTAQGILKKFCTRAICTTDDPCDDLAHHRAVNASSKTLRVYPTYRPDKALLVHCPNEFNAWINRLEQATNTEIRSLPSFLDALKRRHDEFHVTGARLSDHGLDHCYACPCTESEAASIFAKSRSGSAATADEQEKIASFLMLFFGRLDAERGWTKQLHIGALRNINTVRGMELGSDSGFDAIGDWPQARSLANYLDLLQRDRALPKIIVYNANPADDYALATIIGSFQDNSQRGRMQFGTAWWFLDHKHGIERQLNVLSHTGLLSRFVGMVTDSRSLMSFSRHEYFRRILCDLFGREMESGELPNDEKLLGTVVRNICFENARQYLGLELATGTKSGTGQNALSR